MIEFLPIAQRWGGEPFAEERMVEGSCASASYPSTACGGSPPRPSAREELE
jgi:hypothetical protein